MLDCLSGRTIRSRLAAAAWERIVIHAGMPKAGSSSVSAWLERHAADLWSDSGIRLCVTQAKDAVLGVRPYVRGSPNSASLLLAAHAAKEHHVEVIESFAASFDEQAESEGVVVLSARLRSVLLARHRLPSGAAGVDPPTRNPRRLLCPPAERA